MNFGEITLLLGLDWRHLQELRWTWPTWVRFKPELLQMPAVVFYDAEQIDPARVTFLKEHPNVRWIPWQLVSARDQREKMITGFVHVPCEHVETQWYLKLDTDAVATGSGPWIKDEWFDADQRGRVPVIISSRWGYTKPRYLLDLLDDWGDRIPRLARFPRLDIPYSSESKSVHHRRIISWIFFARTDWTRQVVSWLSADMRLPHPSQDTFLFYCAKRSRKRIIRERMGKFNWCHTSFSRIKTIVRAMGMAPGDLADDLSNHRASGNV